MLQKHVAVPINIIYRECLTTAFLAHEGFATIKQPTKRRKYPPTNTLPQNHHPLISYALNWVTIWVKTTARVIIYWKVVRHKTLLTKNNYFFGSS
jgi:hypothetical protein